MTHKTLSRFIAAALMVVIVAAAINIDHIRRGRMGRDAFMDAQSRRYEQHFANPDLQSSVLPSLALCGLSIALYELVAFNTLKVLSYLSTPKSKPGHAETGKCI